MQDGMMNDEAKPYVPKRGDRVTFRYETWGPEGGKGGIAELHCIWIGVEPDPAPGFEPGEIVIGSPDLAD